MWKWVSIWAFIYFDTFRRLAISQFSFRTFKTWKFDTFAHSLLFVETWRWQRRVFTIIPDFFRFIDLKNEKPWTIQTRQIEWLPQSKSTDWTPSCSDRRDFINTRTTTEMIIFIIRNWKRYVKKSLVKQRSIVTGAIGHNYARGLFSPAAYESGKHRYWIIGLVSEHTGWQSNITWLVQ